MSGRLRGLSSAVLIFTGGVTGGWLSAFMHAGWAQGAEVHTHDAHFAQDARDEEWLADVGRRGWAVITKDTRIRYRQTELAALVAGGVRAFVLTRGDLSGPEMAAILVKALPHLVRFSARYEPPFIARIAASGRVQMIYKPAQGSR